MKDDPEHVTLMVISSLNELEIEYLISGSFASAFYGEPRSTRDADLLADVRLEHVGKLCEMLQEDFYIEAEAIKSALKNRTSFNLIHFESLFKVDVFVPRRDFDRQELQRKRLSRLSANSEEQVYFATAEDVILAKLEWFQLGNQVSTQQLKDVRGILKTQADRLDLEYLIKNAKNMGLDDLLKSLLGGGN